VKVSARPSAKPTAAVKSAPKTQAVVAVQNSNVTNEKKTPKAMTAVGHRDPFVSPVVAMGAMGSGCSSGKRCLAIDQIALKGVVKSDNGMIAVVVNAMDKAYFLHENDPVFNGYVVKITGDSIVFKETFHDKLGKALTRDVTKMMSRPVA
jgi:Tfp pilus assembly protein PilP